VSQGKNREGEKRENKQFKKCLIMAAESNLGARWGMFRSWIRVREKFTQRGANIREKVYQKMKKLTGEGTKQPSKTTQAQKQHGAQRQRCSGYKGKKRKGYRQKGGHQHRSMKREGAKKRRGNEEATNRRQGGQWSSEE